MKKFLSILLVAVLVSAMFAIPVSALHWAEGEYDVDEKGNYHPHDSYGFVFDIKDVNATTASEGNIIITSEEAYLKVTNASWVAHALLAPTEEENVYTVVKEIDYPGKGAADVIADDLIDFEGGKILLYSHSSASQPVYEDDGETIKYPNWEQKIAVWGLANTIGAKITLKGIDVANGTCEEGATATVEDKPANKETISYNLVAESTPWEVTGDGSFSYEGDVLTMHANVNWPCIQGYYAEVISVNVENTYLVYDFVVEGEANFNFIFGNDSNFSFSNSTLGLEEGEYNAGSGDLPAGTYTGKIALTDFVKATANLGGTAFPADAVVDGVLTFKGINVFSVGTDVDVIVNKFALETEVEKEPEAPVVITNVALNKEYEISGVGERPEGYTGKVTDGIVPVGLGDNKETEWFGFYNNGDRPTNAPDKVGYFIIDLEDEYALTSIRTHLINKDSWGVAVPEAVTAYVSLDGEAFEEVGSFEIDSTDGVEYWTEIKVACNAKYVKVEYKLGGTFAFVSEIEVMGGKPGAGGQEPEGPTVEEQMKELLGEAPENAMLDFVIDAPETYKAGDDITVTVTVKNITAENGIHVLEFALYYDNEKLLITNDLDEEDYNALLCIDELPNGWENLSNVANDWTEETEEGTVVNPLNDGKINVIALTDKTSKSAAVKDDDVLVFTFTFKALEDAKGDIGLVIPHAEAEGAYNTDNGADKYEANGDYAVIVDPTAEKPGDDTKPGDASNMIVFAIIALVAIMGSAVVIKTRK